MGHDIESGEEIQEAIKDLAGTHVANIMPNREGQDMNESNIKFQEDTMETHTSNTIIPTQINTHSKSKSHNWYSLGWALVENEKITRKSLGNE
ncbi:16012_t:CDS:2 [Gigaspora rosea]|nr:16012_t:CDS:2 [Gigaspora rosea]